MAEWWEKIPTTQYWCRISLLSLSKGLLDRICFQSERGAVGEGQDVPLSVTFYNRNFLTWPTYAVSIVPLNDEIGSTTRIAVVINLPSTGRFD